MLSLRPVRFCILEYPHFGYRTVAALEGRPVRMVPEPADFIF